MNLCISLASWVQLATKKEIKEQGLTGFEASSAALADITSARFSHPLKQCSKKSDFACSRTTTVLGLFPSCVSTTIERNRFLRDRAKSSGNAFYGASAGVSRYRNDPLGLPSRSVRRVPIPVRAGREYMACMLRSESACRTTRRGAGAKNLRAKHDPQAL